jgi:hypothetical protein
VPSRSPHRLPPIAAAHQHSANGDAHAEAVRIITRDRTAMLSRASIKSLDSHVSAASSRPAGMGSTRTRVNLTMSKD